MSGSPAGGKRRIDPPREPSLDPSGERTRRLFFALWPNADQQAAMALAAREALEASDGRSVPAGNLHLTLAFLGAVTEPRISAVMAVASRIDATPVQFSFAHVEHWRRAQVLCATPEATPAAAVALAEALKGQLVTAGFAPDLKPFRAHVTLARKVRRASLALGMQPVSWSFSRFALVESRTEADGLLYSALESWLLDRLHFE